LTSLLIFDSHDENFNFYHQMVSGTDVFNKQQININ